MDLVGEGWTSSFSCGGNRTVCPLLDPTTGLTPKVNKEVTN